MLELCGIDSFFIAIETNSTKSSTDVIHSAFSKSGRGFVQENDLISRFANFSCMLLTFLFEFDRNFENCKWLNSEYTNLKIFK